ncbi:MAG: MOSC N-terminal beta barrel domain-containing protein [Mycobacterium sp.]
MIEAGRITEIWRYPVKSMAGERLSAVEVRELGLHADRTWAVRDRTSDATTSAKKLPGLLMCTARYAGTPPRNAGPGHAPEVIIGFPDGREVSSADPAIHGALSSYVDHDVELRALPPVSERDQYRTPMATKADMRTIFGLGPDDPLPDLSMFPIRKLAEISRYATPIGSYVDAYPVHLLTTRSLESMSALAPGSDFDVRRFRPSLLIETPDTAELPELGWCGGVLHAPQCAFSPMIPTIRCVMPTHPQPGLDRDPAITRTVAANAHRCLGVYGDVHTPGRITEGDVLRLDPSDRSPASPGAGAAVKRAVMKAVSAALPRGRG